MAAGPKRTLVVAATLASLGVHGEAASHSVGSLGVAPLEWHSDQIARVVSQEASFGNLGLLAFGEQGAIVAFEGRECVHGGLLSFDVRDDLAFDIDEPVTLEIEFDTRSSPGAVTIAYDKNGEAAGAVSVTLPARSEQRFHVERVVLDRARFAGRGDFDTDFTIAGFANSTAGLAQNMTICRIGVVPNLGYRIAPAAGSDYPYIGHVGEVRTYEQGEVVAEAASSSGAGMLELEHVGRAARGTWFVVKATGRTDSPTLAFGPRRVEAISAPIYVSVDADRTWKRSDVRALAERYKSRLAAFASATYDELIELAE